MCCDEEKSVSYLGFAVVDRPTPFALRSCFHVYKGLRVAFLAERKCLTVNSYDLENLSLEFLTPKFPTHIAYSSATPIDLLALVRMRQLHLVQNYVFQPFLSLGRVAAFLKDESVSRSCTTVVRDTCWEKLGANGFRLRFSNFFRIYS